MAELTAYRSSGLSLVVVLDDGTYYARFGFSAERARGLASVYAGPHLLATELSSDAPSTGELRYASAFSALA